MKRALTVVPLDKIRKDTKLRQEVKLVCNEFTWICPLNPDHGQPDFGILTITYLPRNFLVETKSLKLYLQQYRCYDVFNEELAVRILSDLVYYLQPEHMIVEMAQNQRGGVQNTTNVTYDSANMSHQAQMQDYKPEIGFDVRAWPLIKSEVKAENPVCNNCADNFVEGRTGYGSVKDPKEIIKICQEGQLTKEEAFDLIAKL